ncbi:MAG: acetate uptake transporter [Theionarchaea archaeon]|nr:acetate uptake transporter [Theionarchaea archaeon]
MVYKSKLYIRKVDAKVMTDDIANPAPLGLAGFGLTTLVLNVVNAGIIPRESLGMVLPLGLFYGGLAQFVAGMWEFKKNNTFGATAFGSFGAFWMSFATMEILVNTGALPEVPKGGIAVFLIAWGIFTGCMSIGTFKINRALQVVFITLTVLFFLLAIGVYSTPVHVIAGLEGIFCALSALYTCFAIVINTTWKREVLPLGEIQ